MSYITNVDLTGRRFGNVIVQQVAGRKPELSWYCVCQKCRSSFRKSHRFLLQLSDQPCPCPNEGCRSGRNDFAEWEKAQHREAKRREREAEEQAHEAAMRAKYGPAKEKPQPVPVKPRTDNHESWKEYSLGVLKFEIADWYNFEEWQTFTEPIRNNLLGAIRFLENGGDSDANR